MWYPQMTLLKNIKMPFKIRFCLKQEKFRFYMHRHQLNVIVGDMRSIVSMLKIKHFMFKCYTFPFCTKNMPFIYGIQLDPIDILCTNG